MSYNISSKDLVDPFISPILNELNEFFAERKIRFFLVGALARDIMLQMHNTKSSRSTLDLDIAIAISNWDEYNEIEKGISLLPNFHKDVKQKQRFIYRSQFEIDIVPYGEIMQGDEKIFWPPDEQFAMTVLGFEETEENVQSITIDENLTIEVASLLGILLLKIFAWKDRHLRGNKDADDIIFILHNYLNIHLEDAIQFYEKIYEDKNFTELSAGGKLAGIHMNGMLQGHENTRLKAIEILREELDKMESSLMLQQMQATNKLGFDDIVLCISNLVVELGKNDE